MAISRKANIVRSAGQASGATAAIAAQSWLLGLGPAILAGGCAGFACASTLSASGSLSACGLAAAIIAFCSAAFWSSALLTVVFTAGIGLDGALSSFLQHWQTSLASGTPYGLSGTP